MKTDFADIKLYVTAIEDCVDYIDRRIRDRICDYAGTGKYRTVYHWEHGERVPDLDEEGNVKQTEIYDYLPRKDEELDEDDKRYVRVNESLKELILNILKEVIK